MTFHDVDKLSDEDLIQMGYYIDDPDLGKIPLISPYDSDEIKVRKEKIIDQRVDEITEAWDIKDKESSHSILKKIIYDVSEEVSKDVEEKVELNTRVTELLIERIRVTK